MSRTKAMTVLGRVVWAADNPHDIAVATMVDVASSDERLQRQTVDAWRRWASIPDIALTYPDPSPGSPPPEVVRDVVAAARQRLQERGDVTTADLATWSVLPGALVSGGFLRVPLLPVQQILDVVDGLLELLDGTFPPDPPNSWWILGVDGGRRPLHGPRLSY